jgi:two-component system response regulator YesN
MYKVIIVDDEYMAKLGIKTIIEQEIEGFTVVGEAEDGVQALRLMEQYDPDVIVTDIRMPIMDGLTLNRQVKGNRKKTEVIFVSGYDDFEYVREALRSGATDYLLKPIDEDVLIAVFAKIREKFQQEETSMREQKEWLWTCKTNAERIANYLWLMDDQAIERELKKQEVDYYSDEDEPELIKQKSYIYLTLVKRELQQLGLQDEVPDPDVTMSLKYASNLKRLHLEVCEYIHTLRDAIMKSRNWGYDRVVKQTRAYIDSNYMNDDLSLKQLADQYKMSVSYFSYIFKTAVGMTFVNYLTKLRMEQAKKCLNNPCIRIYEVSHSVGFHDYAHFAKAFKKYSGCSPTEYRKRVGISEA